MNSAEHKAEAERLLEWVDAGAMYPDRVLTTALVHATLATIPDPVGFSVAKEIT